MKSWHAILMRSENWQMPKHSVCFVGLMLGGMLLLGAAVPGLAQPDRLLPPKPVGGAIKPAVVTAQASAPAPAATPPKEWSGESGSSGHPDMQASAIRAAAA